MGLGWLFHRRMIPIAEQLLWLSSAFWAPSWLGCWRRKLGCAWMCRNLLWRPDGQDGRWEYCIYDMLLQFWDSLAGFWKLWFYRGWFTFRRVLRSIRLGKSSFPQKFHELMQHTFADVRSNCASTVWLKIQDGSGISYMSYQQHFVSPTLISRPRSLATWARTASPMGDRQILPIKQQIPYKTWIFSPHLKHTQAYNKNRCRRHWSSSQCHGSIALPHSRTSCLMPPPPVQVFLTTIASQASLRQRQGNYWFEISMQYG